MALNQTNVETDLTSRSQSLVNSNKHSWANIEFNARDGKKDNLKHIKGVGPKIEGILNKLGIFHFDQIAAWNRETIDWVDNELTFKGRIDREKWVSQAEKLAKGEKNEFSKKVAKSSVATSKKGDAS